MKDLPPSAKRVFLGKIFDVWQWEQKMYDGTTGIFEALKRPNTAQVIPVVGDKILIELQEQPHLREPFPSLPGGRCEQNEEPLEAAKRELLEETGYASDDWTLWIEQNPVGKIVWTVYTYVARNCRRVKDPELDAGERITVKFISFDEFLALHDDPNFYEQELRGILLRAQYDLSARKGLVKLLFG